MRSHFPQAAAVLATVAAALSLGTMTSVQAQEPSAEPTGIGIRLLEAPVALADDPRAQNYLVDNLPPGTLIERRIGVTNDTGADTTVKLYAGEGDVTADGFVFGDGVEGNELTSWMTVTPSEVPLAAGQSSEAVVRVAVPEDATEGERYAVVWAEVESPPIAGSITSVTRAGIRAYISVGPGNGPPEDFEVTSVTPERSDTGAPTLAIEIENIGGRALDPTGTATLSDGPGGLSTTPITDSGGSIAPGASGVLRIELDRALPPGPWTADVSVNSGRVNRDAAASITFPEQSGDAVATATTGTIIPVWAWAIAATVAAAAIVSVAWLLRKRASAGVSR